MSCTLLLSCSEQEELTSSRKLMSGLALALLVSRTRPMPASVGSTPPLYLELSSGGKHRRLAYHSVQGSTNSPGVVCCNGFRSHMSGRNAAALEHHLTDWIQDTLDVVDHLTCGPQILVGSSMGAWIAVHVALQRPERVAAIVGVAAAPDFTRELWNKLPALAKKDLQEVGVYHRPSSYSEEPYPITMNLINDAQRWFLLSESTSKRIHLNCPVHLLHGQKDTDILWEQSLALAERLESPNLALTLVKNGDHRLSELSDLHHIVSAVQSIARRSSTAIDPKPQRNVYEYLHEWSENNMHAPSARTNNRE